MDHSYAHLDSQRVLKQRNMLGLASIVLFVLVVVAFGAAATREREIILQPVIPQPITISSSGVSRDYLEYVTRDTAQLALNRSPETLNYWMESLLELAAPEARGALKTDLVKIYKEQSGSQISQFFTIDWIRVDPDTLTSEVGGVLHTVAGSREVSRVHRSFRFVWSYSGLSLRLKGFGMIERAGSEAA